MTDESDLSMKLDQLLAKNDVFTHAEADTLRHMAAVYESVSGFVKVTKTVGFVIAFVVLLWTNWDRLRELIGIRI